MESAGCDSFGRPRARNNTNRAFPSSKYDTLCVFNAPVAGHPRFDFAASAARQASRRYIQEHQISAAVDSGPAGAGFKATPGQEGAGDASSSGSNRTGRFVSRLITWLYMQDTSHRLAGFSDKPRPARSYRRPGSVYRWSVHCDSG